MIPLVKVGMPDKGSLLPLLEEVLYSGMIAEGEYVYEFEKQFAAIFGLPIAVAVNSGTAALHLALILSGVQQNDEVVTTSMTAEPTNTAILQSGAIPIFADIDEETGNLSPESVELAITPRTKAIVVVHYAGFPADLENLRRIADKHKIALIEDAAHALGASYKGKAVGTIGDYGIFSFQAIKHMTTVEGGVLAMKNQDQVLLAKKLRWFGLSKGVSRTEIDITSLGYKYNMNNVTAAIGLVQLASIMDRIKKHVENGQYFNAALASISGLSVTRIECESEPSYWLYSIFSDDSQAIEACLARSGVTASKLHRPNHHHSIFGNHLPNLPRLEAYYKRLTHIPCGWWVNDEDREHIVQALQRG